MMIIMELSLMALGLVFIKTAHHRHALTFGVASLYFLFSMALGSVGIAAFGLVILAYGISRGFDSSKHVRRTVVSMMMVLALVALAIQHGPDRSQNGPSRTATQPDWAMFTSNSFGSNFSKLPQTISRLGGDRIEKFNVKAIERVPIELPEPNKGRLQRLRSLSDSKLVSLDTDSLKQMLETPMESVGDLQQLLKDRQVRFEATAGNVTVNGSIEAFDVPTVLSQLDKSTSAEISNVNLAGTLDVHVQQQPLIKSHVRVIQ